MRINIMLIPLIIFIVILPSIIISGFNNKTCSGGIYGYLKIKVNDQYISPEIASIYLSGTNMSINIDSSGLFYFSDVPPGEYKAIVKAPNFADMIVEKVNVSIDSISIVDMRSLIKQSFSQRRQWQGKKIKKIDINRKGDIIGRVNIDKLNLSACPYIRIQGTPWDAKTDSVGNYQICNIISGSYTVIMSLPYYHYIKIYDVKVRYNATSIVDFERLLPEIFPVIISPIRWVEKYKN